MNKNISIIQLQTFADNVYKLPSSILADTRYVNESNDKFLRLNRDAFKYLHVDAYNENGKIHFKANELIGAIPIRMPDKGNGKYMTDLIVKPRYQLDSPTDSDWFKWTFNLSRYANFDLVPDQSKLLKLTRLNGTMASQYVLAQDVITKFDIVIREHSWRRFDSLEKSEKRPMGNINWSRYAMTSVDPQKKLVFETKVNSISENHQKFRNAVAYVNDAIAVINSLSTPLDIKIPLQPIITRIQNQLSLYKISPQRVNQSFFELFPQDSRNLCSLKRALNHFIYNNSVANYAWRIDFSKLYEKFVQKIVSQAFDHVEKNKRVPKSFDHSYDDQVTKLFPRYLEPDIVAKLGQEQIIIDAKYKSYFFSRHGESKDSQKQRLRADVHQVIAYTKLIDAKIAILVAPTMKSLSFELVHYGGVYVSIVGLPLDLKMLGEKAHQIRRFTEAAILKLYV